MRLLPTFNFELSTVDCTWHGAMPVHRAGMIKAPVDGDPPRPPGLQAKLFGARGVASDLENVEILAGEDVPVAVEERAAQMFGQSFQRTAIEPIVRVDRVVC